MHVVVISSRQPPGMRISKQRYTFMQDDTDMTEQNNAAIHPGGVCDVA